MLVGIRAGLDADATFTWVSSEFMSEHEVAPWDT